MKKSSNPFTCAAGEKSKEDQEFLVTRLRKEKVNNGVDLYQYEGFWCPAACIHGVISFQKHFQAAESDIILSTYPKSGTTWIKALTYSIVKRSRYAFEDSPLLTNSSHQLVPCFEFSLYDLNNQSPNLERYSTPRVFQTHVPYASLPGSILKSNCRIVYICRNPLDQFISEWQFIPRLTNSEQTQVDQAFERACQGIQMFGPMWEHVLGYWKASIEQPLKILFLKYEDLKEDVAFYIKRLADFLGCPFSEDEVNQGVVQEMSKLCSFDNIKNLEVTRTGKVRTDGPKNSIFLRKGEVGDWKNYLSPSMSQRLEKIMAEKLAGSGLTFKTSLEGEPKN